MIKPKKTPRKKSSLAGLKLGEFIRTACDVKKAEDIRILDLRKRSGLSDFFVIASAGSDRQARAIADHVMEMLAKEGVRILSKEGMNESQWVLVDCGDVILHIFHKDIRKFYNLERLWGEKEVEVDEG